MKRLKRENKEVHVDSEGSWAISYGDMITLLLGFFILFFSLEPAQKKESKISQSLLITMKSLDEGSGKEKKDKEIAEKDGVLSGKGKMSAKAEKPEGFSDNNIFLIKTLKAEVRKEGEKLVINFPGESFFRQGSTDINARGVELLQKFAEVYTPFSGKTKLNIIGYSDPRPVTSKYRRYRDNLELSVLRAVAAQRVLQKSGIPIKQTRLMGFGVKNKLLAEEKAKNKKQKYALSRKIMLVVEPTEGGQ